MKNSYTEEEYRMALEKWKNDNPDKEYNEMQATEKVEIETERGIKTIAIGQRISIIKLIYKAMQEGKHYGTNKDLTEEEIEYYSTRGLLEKKYSGEKEFKLALEKWKSENPGKRYGGIKNKDFVEIETEAGLRIVPIGDKISRIRLIYKAMQEGKKYKTYANLTQEEIDFYRNEGVFEESKGIKYTEEEYRMALEKWKNDNPDKEYSNIKQNTVVEIVTESGTKSISIGKKISNIRSIYKAMQEGKKYGRSKDLTDEQIEYYSSRGLLDNKYKKNNNSTNKQSQLDKYIELFDGDKNKALKVIECLNDLKLRRKDKKKDDYDISNLLKEFDINLEKLDSYLSRTRGNNNSSKSATIMYKDTSLRKYCILNGYNYEVIVRAIKLHKFLPNEDLESLINRSIVSYLKKGQKEPATWIYEKYGTLVKHILLYLNLDASKILTDMSDYTISLEEAIRHQIFLKNRIDKKNDWLEEVYNYLIEELNPNKSESDLINDLVTKYQDLLEKYKLNHSEHSVVVNSFRDYIKTIKEYQKVDVGLETDNLKKIEKIKDYGLEEEDIEESFYIPLEFDNKVLIGRKSELYKRRQLLRQYTLDWDLYTELEKEEIIKNNHFSSEEVEMINKTRKDIEEVIVKSRK